MEAFLLTAIFMPFLLIPAVLATGRKLRARTAWLALAAPLASVALIVQVALLPRTGGSLVIGFPWVPTLGLGLTFLIDGLSLFYGLVVSGMGVLVVFYAQYYLDEHYEDHGRFYAYLLLFMGAMLGTVFAGDLLLLFVFWELTGIASFLLIGFLHGKESSRQGAQMALLVTGATGLAMLAGVVILGQQTGTYELATLLRQPLTAESSGAVTAAFVLIALGAMGKSAQFPFHFWLPNAMAAPTPVSAYLHSATMVKLGIFLVARIFPIFNGLELWTPLLVSVGFGTMALAAFLALLSHDLKAILAYSTVTTLGLLIGFYGMGGPGGVQGDLLHVSSHVFFKGALFMVAGIVDHATGTRDIRVLGGLRQRLPWLAILMVICAASMAGVPGTLGFVSKEYFLKAQLAFLSHGGALAQTAVGLAAFALLLKVAFSARLVLHVFGGRETPESTAHFHAPPAGLLIPPTLLAAASLVFGFWPQGLARALDSLQVAGLHRLPALAFKPFPTHWAPEVALSAGILAGGVALYFVLGRAAWARLGIPSLLRFDGAFQIGVKALPVVARRLTTALRSDRPFDYLPIVMGFAVLTLGAYLVHRHDVLLPVLPAWYDFHPLRTFVAALIAVAVFLVLAQRSWTGQLIAMAVIGFLVTFYFVLFQAPDLAMTQILVETATLLLVLLLLARFPQSAEADEHDTRSSPRRFALRLAIAVGMGTLTTLLSVIALTPRHPAPAGDYYLNNTVELAYGTNAVNTLLVDFRGFDTLFEISVLVIATVGAMGLFMRHRRTRDEYEAGSMSLPTGSRKRHVAPLPEDD